MTSSKFSKSHYEKIALTIATKIMFSGPKCGSETDFVIEKLIQMFEENNPKFDRKKFEYVCGYR